MIRRIVALAALALAAAPVARAEAARAQGAQDGTAPNVSIGFGVGLEPLSLVSTSPTTNGLAPVAFYIPIQIGPQLRIEPSIGIWHLSANENVVSPSSETVWNLGVGGLFYLSPPTPTGFYVGGRLGLTHSSITTDAGVNKVDSSSTDFSIAPVLGGEYAFASRFTFGAELQLPITWYGNVSETQGGTTVTRNADRTGVATNAVVFLRYFFL